MERKNVTNTAKMCLRIYNIGLFAYIWVAYYNHFCFHLLSLWGGITSILTYFIIYSWLCNTFKAFGIASCRITETVFSQFLAFGIADLLLYIECCLIHNSYVNIQYGLVIAGAQTLGTILIVACAKQYYMKNILPKTTLLVYGEHINGLEAEHFSRRLQNRYSHLFLEKRMTVETVSEGQLERLIDECETVMLYEVSEATRKHILEYGIEQKKAVYFTPNIMDLFIQGCSPRHLLDTPLFKYDYPCEKYAKDVVKRTADIVLSLFAIVLTAPLMLLIGLAIKLEDKGPVFYEQDRYTNDFKVFRILKFRSMIVDAEKDGFRPCINKDARITRVGKLIRPFRLDELPQLLNILVGDMSFVGPRPERIEHVKEYMKNMPTFGYRLRVKGGLTGYAQIYGKYNTSPYDKLRLDLMYIERRSLLLDCKLILLTLKILFSRESTEGFEEEKSREISLGYDAKSLASPKQL